MGHARQVCSFDPIEDLVEASDPRIVVGQLRHDRSKGARVLGHYVERSLSTVLFDEPLIYHLDDVRMTAGTAERYLVLEPLSSLGRGFVAMEDLDSPLPAI